MKVRSFFYRYIIAIARSVATMSRIASPDPGESGTLLALIKFSYPRIESQKMHRGKICKPSETLDQGIRRFDRWTIFWPISSASQALQSPPTPEFPIINMHSSWLDKTVGKQDIWGLLSFENLSDFYAKKQSSIPLSTYQSWERMSGLALQAGWPLRIICV